MYRPHTSPCLIAGQKYPRSDWLRAIKLRKEGQAIDSRLVEEHTWTERFQRKLIIKDAGTGSLSGPLFLHYRHMSRHRTDVIELMSFSRLGL